jgi:PAS domain S-box-containing protein
MNEGNNSFVKIISASLLAIFIVSGTLLFLSYTNEKAAFANFIDHKVRKTADFLEAVTHFDVENSDLLKIDKQTAFKHSISQFASSRNDSPEFLRFAIVHVDGETLHFLYHGCVDEAPESINLVDAPELFKLAALQQHGSFEGKFLCLDGTTKNVLAHYQPLENGVYENIFIVGMLDIDLIYDKYTNFVSLLVLLTLAVAFVLALYIHRIARRVVVSVENTEARYDQLFDMAPVALAFVTQDGTLERINRRFIETYGYENEEIPDLDRWFPTAYPDPEYRKWVLKTWNDEVERATRTQTDIIPHEYNVTCKDGSIKQMLIGGVMIGTDFIATHLDISELRLRENELLSERDFHAKVLEALDSMVIVLDDQGTVTLANNKASEILGYSVEEIEGQNWFNHFLPIENKHEVLDYYQRSLNRIEHLPQYHENEILCKDGSTKMVSWRNAMIKSDDESNHYSGVISSGIDISEQVSLQEELKHSKEMMLIQARHAAMGEMIGLIAHQWRQPLATISMNANSLMADIEFESLEPEASREYVDGILEQTQFLSHTIDDFRNFFHPKQGVETVEIMKVCEELISIIGKSLEYSNVAFDVRCKENIAVKLYARELLQVLLNLVKNAKEALVSRNIEEKRITLSVSEIGHNVVIEVRDNGGGIANDIMDRLFEPYFTTKDEHSGTGLGLYMSKTIIEKHLNGTIQARNRDEGACFTITIPKGAQSE